MNRPWRFTTWIMFNAGWTNLTKNSMRWSRTTWKTNANNETGNKTTAKVEKEAMAMQHKTHVTRQVTAEHTSTTEIAKEETTAHSATTTQNFLEEKGKDGVEDEAEAKAKAKAKEKAKEKAKGKTTQKEKAKVNGTQAKANGTQAKANGTQAKANGTQARAKASQKEEKETTEAKPEDAQWKETTRSAEALLPQE